ARSRSSGGYLLDEPPDMTPSFPRTGVSGHAGAVHGYNLAAVLAGLPDDLIKPPVLPPPTMPSGPGPFGLPIPNPNYHP
ncbi:hypothetical protein, partial [Mycobacterium tuberculosis]